MSKRHKKLRKKIKKVISATLEIIHNTVSNIRLASFQ